MKKLLFSLIGLLSFSMVEAQIFHDNHNFTKQDTLRGSVTPERAWWDLTYYHLDIAVDPDKKWIEGKNTIRYKVLESNKKMQIDLQPPMKITKVKNKKGKELDFERDGNVYYVEMKKKPKPGTVSEIVVEYEGYPTEAVRAPWDGGLSWTKDDNGNHFVATSCQGEGASMWWPCKDHMYDEPDSMKMTLTCPDNLTAVGNGRLIGEKKNNDGTKSFVWYVSNPINNYGVNVNIGDYVNFSEKFPGEKGDLDCDYYVLSYNLDTAKVHFKDAGRCLEAFEHWFGPYPFYEDSYKLVEVPYLGMEHQSSVTYGNEYKKGYLGNDLSRTGWGLDWDYIIIHETGHEWFANNITYKDIADMWVHEGFTCYSEAIFVEYFYGKDAGAEYVRGLRGNISNREQLIGPYGVNKSGSGDMYSKGANILHTLRQVINDDDKWREILRGLNSEFYHKTVTTKDIEDFMAKKAGLDLDGFFNQYLRDFRIPALEYVIRKGRLAFRWSNCIEEFKMPVKVYVNGEEKWLDASTRWNAIEAPEDATFKIDKDFYILSLPFMGE